MLDIIAVALLLMIITLPVSVYFFDRWGFEAAGPGCLYMIKRRTKIIWNIAMLLLYALIIALPVSLFFFDR